MLSIGNNPIISKQNVGKQGERGEAKISSRQTRLNAVDGR
jgi:hypothetical protein